VFTALNRSAQASGWTRPSHAPVGHPGNSNSTIDADGNGLADDLLVEIPAIGAQGGNPLPGFLEGVFGPTP